jgi:predicted O-linked N-acetylglucosamine transferase (SPINDLY family)
MATIAEAVQRAVQRYLSGNYAGAEELCRRVLDADPAHADALNLRGLVAHAAGQSQAALDYIGKALQIKPESADFYSNRAGVYRALGRSEEASADYQQALRLSPEVPELHCNMGATLAQQGQLQEARASFQEALRLRPEFVEAHYYLANVLKHLDRLPEAEASLGQALRLRPNLVKAYIDLGDVQLETGRSKDAEASYRQGLRLQPESAELLGKLGNTLTQQGRFAEAEACCRAALQLAPELAEAHDNLGRNYAAQGDIDEAMACYERAVQAQEDFADGVYHLAAACFESGLLDKARVYFRKAFALRPDHPAIQSCMLLLPHYPPDYDPQTTFDEHLRWAKQFGDGPVPHRPRHPVDQDPDRRLRIGYVSADFRDHVMGRYSEAVITAHDRGQFEVFCYANVQKEDSRTQRIKAVADHWHPIFDVRDHRVADLILDDRIDLLIDLGGHTATNRVAVFARKPAPVQVTHCGYPDTTGLAAIDYRLTDPYCDPPGQTERWHREKVVHLPEAHWCYAPPSAIADVGPLPAREPGAVTFASFNYLPKVTEPMLGLWARILLALPASRLLIQIDRGRAGAQWVRAAFTRHGIPAQRLTLVTKVSSEAYYRRVGEVDICLDTYPYTGCNTTADALWMGVPVVTLAGSTCVTRLGVSALALAGLEDLVTETPEAYVDTAVALARDLSRLRELRATLRDRVQQSLGDVPRFTRQLEAAYRAMWRAYCAAGGD